MNRKNLIRLKTLPSGTILPRTAVNSATTPLTTTLKLAVSWLGINQYTEGRNKNNSLAANQLPANLNPSIVFGSKIENRFPI